MEETFALTLRVVKKDPNSKTQGSFDLKEILQSLKINPFVAKIVNNLLADKSRMVEISIKSPLYNGIHYFDAK